MKMPTKLIEAADAVKLVAEHKATGKVFGVRFIKKDNTNRVMACRFNVKAHLTTTDGRASTTAHIPKYITVFDMKKVAYRNVNLDTLIHIVAGGVKHILA